jgi:tricarballylate dehydrogenase
VATAYDVVVVGGGNAAMCAALSAQESGARVLVLEKAPEAWRGGNGFFTAGGFRFAFKSFDELRTLIGDLSDQEAAQMEVDPYTEDNFYDDLMRVTEDCADPDMALFLVRESQNTVRWMKDRGIRWIPMFGRQAYKVGGKFRFWGGLVLEAVGGGPGLIDMEYASAAKAGIDVRFETKATRLITDDRGRVTGIMVRTPEGTETISAGAVVLASGGFEANPEMRTRYLGPNWELARVRGTPYNTGDGIRMAIDIGALPWGHWSGCHSVQWDLNAPWHGDRKVGDNFQKHSYPVGIIVNLRGERFVDEGADFRNYTYVKYGRAVIGQPRRTAFQIFDQKVVDILREEYRIREVTKAEANTFEDLARKLEIDVPGFVKTVTEFNAAVMKDVPFNPAVKDGRGTRGLALPKSNWAQALDTPPYVGFAVTTGITFTFGGLKIDDAGRVIDCEQRAIPGLFAAGELVGGLFYHT